MFFAASICAALALFAGSSNAAPSTSDWKYAHGWDGVVSSPTSIGTPLNTTAKDLTTRAADTVGGIFLCSDINWGGTCGYAVQPLSTCIVLGNDWNDLISSIGPDPGTLVVAYDASDCTGTLTQFSYPGNGDLVDIGWNDRISSFEALAA